MNEREIALAEELGVPRGLLRKVRAGLERGRDWSLEHNAVVYSPAGLERLRLAVASRLAETPAGAREAGRDMDAEGEAGPEGGDGLPGAENAPPPQRNGARAADLQDMLAEGFAKKAPPPPRRVEMTVVRLQVHRDGSPGVWLFCRLQGQPGLQRVRTRGNGNFVKKMVLPARHEHGDRWILARRHPREKGRW